MLSLCTLTYVIQIYMQYIILFWDFEKFRVYDEFQSKSNPQRSEPNPDQNLEIAEWG